MRRFEDRLIEHAGGKDRKPGNGEDKELVQGTEKDKILEAEKNGWKVTSIWLG